MTDRTVSFTPSGRRGTFPTGTTVLDAARSLGVDLDSVCGGRGICGRCQVEVGERPGVSADPERLGARTLTEQDYQGGRQQGRRPLESHRRLGCAATIADDVVVAVPTSSQVHRQVVRKDAVAVDITIDPAVVLRYAEVPEPTLEGGGGDLQRLRTALEEAWDLTDLAIDLSALTALQPALEAGKRGVTVAIRRSVAAEGLVIGVGGTVVAVWPGLRDVIHGVAIDIGSTTIAGHLCDLSSGAVLASAGRMNPQITFGEDLMSRVSYVMMNEGGQQRLTDSVRQALAEIIAELCDIAGVPTSGVLEVCLVGNPIMHHLVLGMDPTPLGSAPFALATTDAVTVAASDLSLGINPGGRVYVPPCIAGHVGADAVAMILAEAPHRSDELTLLVDVGTNAEIVLGDSGGLLAASSPTGPAFEGAQISSGQRAAPGAIERVRIDPATLVPRYRVIGSDLWSDEPGFDAAVADTGVTGICGSGIIEVIAELFLAGVVRADGQLRPPAHGRHRVGHDVDGRVIADGRTFAYRLVPADGDRGQAAIDIIQNDVRAIQLAKAALHAGCRLLMDHRGVDRVDRIRLAGAFGSHIDPLYAMVLGLIPDCDLDAVAAAGNAAGQGALAALLSVTARSEIETVAAEVTKVETAVEPAFQAHFISAMGLPHTTDPYTALATRVTLPVADPETDQAGGRGARRRSRRAVS